MIENNMENKYITFCLVSLLVSSVLLNLCLFGSMLNLQAMAANGGKMPVLIKDQNYSFSLDKHFSFHNPTEVEYYYLSDLFDFGNIYSIGDFIMYLAFGLVCINALVTVYMSIKMWRNK